MAKIILEKEASEEHIHSQDIESILICKDRLFSAADDGKVKVWSTKDLSLISEFKAHDYAIYDILAMDNDTLFTASVDCTIKAWDLNTFNLKTTISGHEEGVHRLATDGRFLFSGDDRGEVRQWTKDGNLCLLFGLIEEVWGLHVRDNLIFTVRDRDLIVAELQGGSDKYSIKFAHPGRAPLLVNKELVAIVDRTGMNINIFDFNEEGFQNKGVLKKHDRIVTALANYSNFLLSTGYDDQIVLWDLKSHTSIASCPIKKTSSAMAASEDGSIFVGGSDGYLAKFKVTNK